MSIEVVGTFNVISKYTRYTPGIRNRECMPVTIETRVKWRIYGVHVPIHETCHAVYSTFHTCSQTQEKGRNYIQFSGCKGWLHTICVRLTLAEAKCLQRLQVDSESESGRGVGVYTYHNTIFLCTSIDSGVGNKLLITSNC